MTVIHVIGDIHGQRAKLVDLLRGAGLIAADDSWSGMDSILWFMGDLVDHGSEGIGAVEMVMGLQEEAARAGGRVQVLIGNHDLLLMAAYRFGSRPIPGTDETFCDNWEESGGQPADLERMRPDHVRWLSSLPAMTQQGEHLLVHADALLYTDYGRSIAVVNHAFRELMQSDDTARWHRLLEEFSEHGAFADAAKGSSNAESFLSLYGGQRIVHGHTPIAKLTGQPPEAVREALVYTQAHCIDVDPGMYLGGPGFIYRLSSPEEMTAG